MRVSIEDVEERKNYKLNSTENHSLSDKSKNLPEMPEREIKWFVKHPFGIITVVIVYIFFIKIYAVTIVYAIVPFKNLAIDILHTILFSILAILALWSHAVSMT